jgi:hypothetical protein
MIPSYEGRNGMKQEVPQQIWVAVHGFEVAILSHHFHDNLFG